MRASLVSARGLAPRPAPDLTSLRVRARASPSAARRRCPVAAVPRVLRAAAEHHRRRRPPGQRAARHGEPRALRHRAPRRRAPSCCAGAPRRPTTAPTRSPPTTPTARRCRPSSSASGARRPASSPRSAGAASRSPTSRPTTCSARSRRSRPPRAARCCCSPATATCSSASTTPSPCSFRAAARTGRRSSTRRACASATGSSPSRCPTSSPCAAIPSDGLPGAKGIGAKTARDLLRAHGTLEGVIAAASKPGAMTPRQAGALTGDPDALRAFKDIATLRRVDLERPARRPARPRRRRGRRARARNEPPRRTARAGERGNRTHPAPDSGIMCAAVRLLCALAAVVALALVLPHAASAADPSGPVMLAQGWNFAPDPADAGLTDNWQGGVRGNGLGAGHDPPCRRREHRRRRSSAAPSAGTGSASRARRPPTASAGRCASSRCGGSRGSGSTDASSAPTTTPTRRSSCPPPACAPGAPNTLVVRVDYRRSVALREGWWNWGGITRQVSLVARGPVVMHDAGLLPRRVCVESACAWNVLVDGWLENRSEGVQQPAVTVRLQSPDGDVSEGSVTPRALRPRRTRAPALHGADQGRPEDVVARASRTATPARSRRARAGRSCRSTSARSGCAPSTSATGCCASTTARWTCAAPRSRRTSPAAARR